MSEKNGLKKYEGKVVTIDLQIKSKSNPDKTYLTSYTKESGFECNCPGFAFRRSCGHMALLGSVVTTIENSFLNEKTI